jgi:CheY-specific phosphatase CheX
MAVQFFGQFLIQEQAVKVENLREALDLMESRNRSFCDLAKEEGLISALDAERLASMESSSSETASQVAVEENLMTVEQVERVLKEQQGRRLRIGEALVELGYLKNDALEGLLTRFHTEQSRYELGKVSLPPELEGNLAAEYVVDFFPKLIEQVSSIRLKVSPDSSTEVEPMTMIASLAIFGGVGVRVSLTSDEAFARALLAGVAGALPSPDHETLQSVLAEFLNIVLGNAIAALERHNITVELDTPELGVVASSSFWFPLVSTVGTAVLGLELVPE